MCALPAGAAALCALPAGAAVSHAMVDSQFCSSRHMSVNHAMVHLEFCRIYFGLATLGHSVSSMLEGAGRKNPESRRQSW